MTEQNAAAQPTKRPQRVWLDVPFSEKEEAKSHGARWDPAEKRWYASPPLRPGVDRWAARPDVPDLLPGEDRGFGTGLFVDMVPRSCWFTNVRSCVSQQDWERLRRMVTRRAEQRCEACACEEDRDRQRWLEVHERWHYDDANLTQTLRRLICLCSDCHQTTHLGLANIRGHAGEALAHLRAVTGMTSAEVTHHVDAANQLWTARSRRIWTLDLTMLTAAGVTIVRPPTPAERQRDAERRLTAERSPSSAHQAPAIPPARSVLTPLMPQPTRSELLAEARHNGPVVRLRNWIAHWARPRSD